MESLTIESVWGLSSILAYCVKGPGNPLLPGQGNLLRIKQAFLTLFA